VHEVPAPAAPAAPARAGHVRGGGAGAAAAVLSTVLTLAAAVLDAGNDPEVRRAVGDLGWTSGAAGTALVVAGALVLRDRGRHVVGWLLVVSGLHWTVDGLAASWLVRAVQDEPVLPGAASPSGCSPAPAPGCCSRCPCSSCCTRTAGCRRDAGGAPRPWSAWR
jgi:hypothetical protein